MSIFKKILSLIFYSIFLLGVISTIHAIYDGRAESIVAFFKMLTIPSVILANPHGAALIAGQALVQFFIIWLFFYIGKKLWKSSNKVLNDEKIENDIKIEPGFENNIKS
jgi:hypothetical protein